MNDHISILNNFFMNYLDNLIENNIASDINKKNISLDYISKNKKGHISSNLLLIIKKKIIDNFDIESDIKIKIKSIDFVDYISVDKGFINIFIKKIYLLNELIDILNNEKDYPEIKIGNNKNINIEFVSANPTGPIHVAHIRGAVFGDVLTNILKKTGFNITKEYYVNDAGSQIEILGNSLFKRYCQLFNVDIEINDNEYPGEYLIDIARKLAEKDNEKWIDNNSKERKNYFENYSIKFLIECIKDDLKLIGIEFDQFSYESHIVEKNLIEKLFKILEKNNLIYEGVLEKPKSDDSDDWEPRKQLLFKSSKLFDNQDRAFQKSDKSWTYFANDSAYHYDKFLRNYDKLINIWGSDHIGYISRMKSLVYSLSNNENYFNVLTCQIVRLIKNNQIVKMSKREGNFVTLRDLYNSVGKDALRYFMVSTKNETAMDFDLDKVIEKNKDNPVFYCQYAFARASSVINKAKDLNIIYSHEKDKKYLSINYISEKEWDIILKLLAYQYLLLQCSITHEPHRITNYLEDLASLFHTFWNMGNVEKSLRFIDEENINITKTKLLWLQCFKVVFKNAFEIIGIEAPENM